MTPRLDSLLSTADEDLRGRRSIVPAAIARAEILVGVMSVARNKHFPVAARLAAIRTALRLKYHDLDELERLIPSRVRRSTSRKPKTRAKADTRRDRLEFEILKLQVRISELLLAKQAPKARRRRSSPLHVKAPVKTLANRPASALDAVSQGPVDSDAYTGGNGAFPGEKLPLGSDVA